MTTRPLSKRTLTPSKPASGRSYTVPFYERDEIWVATKRVKSSTGYFNSRLVAQPLLDFQDYERAARRMAKVQVEQAK